MHQVWRSGTPSPGFLVLIDRFLDFFPMPWMPHTQKDQKETIVSEVQSTVYIYIYIASLAQSLEVGGCRAPRGQVRHST